jgi:hypothetical protein
MGGGDLKTREWKFQYKNLQKYVDVKVCAISSSQGGEYDA